MRHDGRSKEFVRDKRTIVDWEIAGIVGRSLPRVEYSQGCQIWRPAKHSKRGKPPFPPHSLTAFPPSFFVLGQRRLPRCRYASTSIPVLPCIRCKESAHPYFFFNFAVTAFLSYFLTYRLRKVPVSTTQCIYYLPSLPSQLVMERIRSTIPGFHLLFFSRSSCVLFFKFPP